MRSLSNLFGAAISLVLALGGYLLVPEASSTVDGAGSIGVPDAEAAAIMGGQDVCNGYARLEAYVACNLPGCVATAAYQAGAPNDIWYTYKYAIGGPCPTTGGGGSCGGTYYGDFKGCSANPIPGGPTDPG